MVTKSSTPSNNNDFVFELVDMPNPVDVVLGRAIVIISPSPGGIRIVPIPATMSPATSPDSEIKQRCSGWCPA